MADENGKGMTLSCPACHGTRLIKYGRTAAGLQKYRCEAASCRHQFVAGSDHLVDQETKQLVMRMLAAGIDPKKIHQALPEGEISLGWIYKLRRKMRADERRGR